MARIYSTTAMQCAINLIINNLEQDDDGDYKFDFIGNKSPILHLDEFELEEFRRFVDSTYVDISCSA
ncbi:MAG: hypothetical protein MJZ30_11555 [Paludibacteraceae bacterium]|nr:hypothetical protein [Paludibacteraceae bacterium]